MIRAPNRHAQVFNPYQQERQWHSRIVAEEKFYAKLDAEKSPMDAAAAAAAAGTSQLLPGPSVDTVKRNHDKHHRGVDFPPSARSSARTPLCEWEDERAVGSFYVF